MNTKLSPFVLQHNTTNEGSRTKVHFVKSEEMQPKTLCGVDTSLSGSAMPYSIDEEYLLQPDPDTSMCKKCRLAAMKISISDYKEEFGDDLDEDDN